MPENLPVADSIKKIGKKDELKKLKPKKWEFNIAPIYI